MGSRRLRSLGFSLPLYATALLLTAPHGALAQDPAQTTAPPHLAFVDGHATLERDGQAESATPGVPLIPGDRLRTERGRLEILFPDGSALDVDEFASIEIQSPTLMRLTQGRLILTVAGVSDPANAVRYQIDTPAAAAFTEGPGEYRVALLSAPGGPETELAVFRGTATLATETGSTTVRAAERSLARDLMAPSYPLPFNSARFDAFERWAAARRDARLGTASARYLPRDLYGYSSTFDRHGAWDYEPSYGYVWYPAVAVGWRPYHHGHWAPYRHYGWTWIGYDPWGWPTHHYGRWGYSRNRWFWIPGFHWGPAWVTWASAPGYVGWCPLGFNNQPVFALSFVSGNPWAGWIVVQKPYFGYSYAVHKYALPPASIPAKTPFIQHAQAPTPPVAAPRPRAIPRPGSATANQQAITRDPALGSRPAVTTRDATAAPPRSAAAGTRYAPDTRSSLAGQRPVAGDREPQAAAGQRAPAASARPQPAAGAARGPSSQTSAPATRWYPPVTMTRPPIRSEAPSRVDPTPPPAAQASPRSGSYSPAAPRGPSAAPRGAPEYSPPPTSRPAPPPPRARPSSPPAAAPPSRAAPASAPPPRSAAPRGAPPAAAPAQPAPSGDSAPSAPAGARSPRGRG
jgi:hypothetical protein